MSTLSYSLGVIVDFGLRLTPVDLDNLGLNQPAVTTFWMVFYKTNVPIKYL